MACHTYLAIKEKSSAQSAHSRVFCAWCKPRIQNCHLQDWSMNQHSSWILRHHQIHLTWRQKTSTSAGHHQTFFTTQLKKPPADDKTLWRRPGKQAKGHSCMMWKDSWKDKSKLLQRITLLNYAQEWFACKKEHHFQLVAPKSYATKQRSMSLKSPLKSLQIATGCVV